MSEEDKKTKKPLNRRSFMATVVGGAAVVGGASTLVAGQAQAQQRPTGRTDSDSGSGSDQANYGRTGVTDSDPYDRPSYGIGRSGVSDSDPVDPANNGRGSGGSRTGLTDSDSGSNADAPNYGRGAPRG